MAAGGAFRLRVRRDTSQVLAADEFWPGIRML